MDGRSTDAGVTRFGRPLAPWKERSRVVRAVNRVAGRAALYGLLVALSLTFAFPLLWMVSTSLKTDPQVYRVPPIWIPNPVRFRNYAEIWLRIPFGTFFLNSAKYSLTTALGTLISSAIVAYGFSRLRWWGRDALFFVCIATMMVPFQVRMIPLYIVFKVFGWLNSYKPLIIPTFFGNAYFIFLLRQFFMAIPTELSDAARIDGCSEVGIFVRIVLPLAQPILAVVALLQMMSAWNNYLGPLIYLNRVELFPLALGLQLMRANFAEELLWPYMMAASTLTIAPIVVIFFVTQQTFVEAITVTGIKA